MLLRDFSSIVNKHATCFFINTSRCSTLNDVDARKFERFLEYRVLFLFLRFIAQEDTCDVKLTGTPPETWFDDRPKSVTTIQVFGRDTLCRRPHEILDGSRIWAHMVCRHCALDTLLTRRLLFSRK